MKVFVLIISDREMRPRSDITTTAVFSSNEAALNVMNLDISNKIDNGDVAEENIERCLDFVASADGRFFWKIEERLLND